MRVCGLLFLNNIFLSVSVFFFFFFFLLSLSDSLCVTNYAHSNHDFRCDFFVLFILCLFIGVDILVNTHIVWRLRNTFVDSAIF